MAIKMSGSLNLIRKNQYRSSISFDTGGGSGSTSDDGEDEASSGTFGKSNTGSVWSVTTSAYEQKREHFEERLFRRPNDRETLAAYADFLFEGGEHDKAVYMFERSIANGNEGRGMLLRLVRTRMSILRQSLHDACNYTEPPRHGMQGRAAALVSEETVGGAPLALCVSPPNGSPFTFANDEVHRSKRRRALHEKLKGLGRSTGKMKKSGRRTAKEGGGLREKRKEESPPFVAMTSANRIAETARKELAAVLADSSQARLHPATLLEAAALEAFCNRPKRAAALLDAHLSFFPSKCHCQSDGDGHNGDGGGTGKQRKRRGDGSAHGTRSFADAVKDHAAWLAAVLATRLGDDAKAVELYALVLENPPPPGPLMLRETVAQPLPLPAPPLNSPSLDESSTSSVGPPSEKSPASSSSSSSPPLPQTGTGGVAARGDDNNAESGSSSSSGGAHGSAENHPSPPQAAAAAGSAAAASGAVSDVAADSAGVATAAAGGGGGDDDTSVSSTSGGNGVGKNNFSTSGAAAAAKRKSIAVTSGDDAEAAPLVGGCGRLAGQEWPLWLEKGRAHERLAITALAARRQLRKLQEAKKGQARAEANLWAFRKFKVDAATEAAVMSVRAPHLRARATSALEAFKAERAKQLLEAASSASLGGDNDDDEAGGASTTGDAESKNASNERSSGEDQGDKARSTPAGDGAAGSASEGNGGGGGGGASLGSSSVASSASSSLNSRSVGSLADAAGASNSQNGATPSPAGAAIDSPEVLALVALAEEAEEHLENARKAAQDDPETEAMLERAVEAAQATLEDAVTAPNALSDDCNPLSAPLRPAPASPSPQTSPSAPHGEGASSPPSSSSSSSSSSTSSSFSAQTSATVQAASGATPGGAARSKLLPPMLSFFYQGGWRQWRSDRTAPSPSAQRLCQTSSTTSSSSAAVVAPAACALSSVGDCGGDLAPISEEPDFDFQAYLESVGVTTLLSPAHEKAILGGTTREVEGDDNDDKSRWRSSPHTQEPNLSGATIGEEPGGRSDSGRTEDGTSGAPPPGAELPEKKLQDTDGGGSGSGSGSEVKRADAFGWGTTTGEDNAENNDDLAGEEVKRQRELAGHCYKNAFWLLSVELAKAQAAVDSCEESLRILQKAEAATSPTTNNADTASGTSTADVQDTPSAAQQFEESMSSSAFDQEQTAVQKAVEGGGAAAAAAGAGSSPAAEALGADLRTRDVLGSAEVLEAKLPLLKSSVDACFDWLGGHQPDHFDVSADPAAAARDDDDGRVFGSSLDPNDDQEATGGNVDALPGQFHKSSVSFQEAPTTGQTLDAPQPLPPRASSLSSSPSAHIEAHEPQDTSANESGEATIPAGAEVESGEWEKWVGDYKLWMKLARCHLGCLNSEAEAFELSGVRGAPAATQPPRSASSFLDLPQPALCVDASAAALARMSGSLEEEDDKQGRLQQQGQGRRTASSSSSSSAASSSSDRRQSDRAPPVLSSSTLARAEARYMQAVSLSALSECSAAVTCAGLSLDAHPRAQATHRLILVGLTLALSEKANKVLRSEAHIRANRLLHPPPPPEAVADRTAPHLDTLVTAAVYAKSNFHLETDRHIPGLTPPTTQGGQTTTSGGTKSEPASNRGRTSNSNSSSSRHRRRHRRERGAAGTRGGGPVETHHTRCEESQLEFFADGGNLSPPAQSQVGDGAALFFDAVFDGSVHPETDPKDFFAASGVGEGEEWRSVSSPGNSPLRQQSQQRRRRRQQQYRGGGGGFSEDELEESDEFDDSAWQFEAGNGGAYGAFYHGGGGGSAGGSGQAEEKDEEERSESASQQSRSNRGSEVGSKKSIGDQGSGIGGCSIGSGGEKEEEDGEDEWGPAAEYWEVGGHQRLQEEEEDEGEQDSLAELGSVSSNDDGTRDSHASGGGGGSGWGGHSALLSWGGKSGRGRRRRGGQEVGADVIGLAEDDVDGVGCGQGPAPWDPKALPPHPWALANAVDSAVLRADEEERRATALAKKRGAYSSSFKKLPGASRGMTTSSSRGMRGWGTAPLRVGGGGGGSLFHSSYGSVSRSASSSRGAMVASRGHSAPTTTTSATAATATLNGFNVNESLSSVSGAAGPVSSLCGGGGFSGSAGFGFSSGVGGVGNSRSGSAGGWLNRGGVGSRFSTRAPSRAELASAGKAAMGNVPTNALANRRARRLRHQRLCELEETSQALRDLQERCRTFVLREKAWERVVSLCHRLVARARWRRGAKLALLFRRSASTIQVAWKKKLDWDANAEFRRRLAANAASKAWTEAMNRVGAYLLGLLCRVRLRRFFTLAQEHARLTLLLLPFGLPHVGGGRLAPSAAAGGGGGGGGEGSGMTPGSGSGSSQWCQSQESSCAGTGTSPGTGSGSNGGSNGLLLLSAGTASASEAKRGIEAEASKLARRLKLSEGAAAKFFGPAVLGHHHHRHPSVYYHHPPLLSMGDANSHTLTSSLTSNSASWWGSSSYFPASASAASSTWKQPRVVVFAGVHCGLPVSGGQEDEDDVDENEEDEEEESIRRRGAAAAAPAAAPADHLKEVSSSQRSFLPSSLAVDLASQSSSLSSRTSTSRSSSASAGRGSDDDEEEDDDDDDQEGQRDEEDDEDEFGGVDFGDALVDSRRSSGASSFGTAKATVGMSKQEWQAAVEAVMAADKEAEAQKEEDEAATAAKRGQRHALTAGQEVRRMAREEKRTRIVEHARKVLEAQKAKKVLENERKFGGGGDLGEVVPKQGRKRTYPPTREALEELLQGKGKGTVIRFHGKVIVPRKTARQGSNSGGNSGSGRGRIASSSSQALTPTPAAASNSGDSTVSDSSSNNNNTKRSTETKRRGGTTADDEEGEEAEEDEGQGLSVLTCDGLVAARFGRAVMKRALRRQQQKQLQLQLPPAPRGKAPTVLLLTKNLASSPEDLALQSQGAPMQVPTPDPSAPPALAAAGAATPTWSSATSLSQSSEGGAAGSDDGDCQSSVGADPAARGAPAPAGDRALQHEQEQQEHPQFQPQVQPQQQFQQHPQEQQPQVRAWTPWVPVGCAPREALLAPWIGPPTSSPSSSPLSQHSLLGPRRRPPRNVILSSSCFTAASVRLLHLALRDHFAECAEGAHAAAAAHAAVVGRERGGGGGGGTTITSAPSAPATSNFAVGGDDSAAGGCGTNIAPSSSSLVSFPSSLSSSVAPTNASPSLPPGAETATTPPSPSAPAAATAAAAAPAAVALVGGHSALGRLESLHLSCRSLSCHGLIELIELLLYPLHPWEAKRWREHRSKRAAAAAKVKVKEEEKNSRALVAAPQAHGNNNTVTGGEQQALALVPTEERDAPSQSDSNAQKNGSTATATANANAPMFPTRVAVAPPPVHPPTSFGFGGVRSRDTTGLPVNVQVRAATLHTLSLAGMPLHVDAVKCIGRALLLPGAVLSTLVFDECFTYGDTAIKPRRHRRRHELARKHHQRVALQEATSFEAEVTPAVDATANTTQEGGAFSSGAAAGSDGTSQHQHQHQQQHSRAVPPSSRPPSQPWHYTGPAPSSEKLGHAIGALLPFVQRSHSLRTLSLRNCHPPLFAGFPGDDDVDEDDLDSDDDDDDDDDDNGAGSGGRGGGGGSRGGARFSRGGGGGVFNSNLSSEPSPSSSSAGAAAATSSGSSGGGGEAEGVSNGEKYRLLSKKRKLEGDDGGVLLQELCNTLYVNSSLQRLHLDGNAVGPGVGGLGALLRAVNGRRKRCVLQELGLTNQQPRPIATSALQRLVDHSSGRYSLLLSPDDPGAVVDVASMGASSMSASPTFATSRFAATPTAATATTANGGGGGFGANAPPPPTFAHSSSSSSRSKARSRRVLIVPVAHENTGTAGSSSSSSSSSSYSAGLTSSAFGLASSVRAKQMFEAEQVARGASTLTAAKLLANPSSSSSSAQLPVSRLRSQATQTTAIASEIGVASDLSLARSVVRFDLAKPPLSSAPTGSSGGGRRFRTPGAPSALAAPSSLSSSSSSSGVASGRTSSIGISSSSPSSKMNSKQAVALSRARKHSNKREDPTDPPSSSSSAPPALSPVNEAHAKAQAARVAQRGRVRLPHEVDARLLPFGDDAAFQRAATDTLRNNHTRVLL